MARSYYLCSVSCVWKLIVIGIYRWYIFCDVYWFIRGTRCPHDGHSKFIWNVIVFRVYQKCLDKLQGAKSRKISYQYMPTNSFLRHRPKMCWYQSCTWLSAGTLKGPNLFSSNWKWQDTSLTHLLCLLSHFKCTSIYEMVRHSVIVCVHMWVDSSGGCFEYSLWTVTWETIRTQQLWSWEHLV
jgi:hypothetical protein